MWSELRSAVAARRRTSHWGFTFVELVVVVSILAVVAAGVAFTVTGIRPIGGAAECGTNADTVRAAVAAYRAQNGDAATPSIVQLRSAHLLGSVVPRYDVVYVGTTLALRGVGACEGFRG